VCTIKDAIHLRAPGPNRSCAGADALLDAQSIQQKAHLLFEKSALEDMGRYLLFDTASMPPELLHVVWKGIIGEYLLNPTGSDDGVLLLLIKKLHPTNWGDIVKEINTRYAKMPRYSQVYPSISS
jgi:hypothetical protein